MGQSVVLDIEEYLTYFFKHKTDLQLSEQLGLRVDEVIQIRFKFGLYRDDELLKKLGEEDKRKRLHNEIEALIYYIHNKKHGLTVDIAKRRLKDLQRNEELNNFST